MVSAIVGVVALIIGLGLGWVLHSVQNSDVTAVANPSLLQQPVPMPAAPDTQLVQSLISVHDLAEAGPVRQQIVEDLGRSGINRVDPQPGAMFDPAAHKAVQRVDATSPMDVDTVANVLRPGWVSGGGILRFAEVAVFSPPEHIVSGPR